MVQNYGFRHFDVRDDDSSLNISGVYSRSKKIVNEYADEYDQMAKASRNADKRALSLFDSAINDPTFQSPTTTRRRHRVVNSTERQLTTHNRPEFIRSSSEQPNDDHLNKIKTNVRRRHDIINNYSPSDSVSHQMKRIERRLDGIMEYKLPDPEYFSNLRKSLNSISSRMVTHRDMLDKYSGVDMGTTVPLSERIDAKCKIIQSRY